MDKSKRIKYLQGLMTEDKWQEAENKYRAKFDKYATYMGNGVYQWRGIYSNDTAELFLIGILRINNIPFKEA